MIRQVVCEGSWYNDPRPRIMHSGWITPYFLGNRIGLRLFCLRSALELLAEASDGK